MPRPLLFVLSLAAGAVCAIAVAACGSDDEGTIPPDVASSMIAALDDARSAEANGDCDAVATAATDVSNAAAGLSTDAVDPDVQTAIIEGAESLHELAGDPEKCASEATGEEDQETTEPTTTEETTTEPTTTEETTTTETKEEEKPAKEPKPKPEPEPEPPGQGQPPGQPDTGGEPPESGGVGGDDNGG